MLKKSLLSLAMVAGAMFSGLASAETYQLNSGANNNSLWNITGVRVTTWNATLNVNATGNSSLTGSLLASNGQTYNISMTLTDTYMNGSIRQWGNFSGSIVGAGTTTWLNDIGAGRDGMDAGLGVNAAPYNPTTALLEFGFWSDTSASGAGTHNFDVNTTVTCSSGTAQANGACSTSSSGGSVPVPGSLALAGLGLVGMLARRSMKRKA